MTGWRPRSVLPQSTLGQIVAIVVSALLVTVSATIAFFATFGPLFPARPVGPGDNVLAIAVAVRALEATQPGGWAALAAAMSSQSFRLSAAGPPSRCEREPEGDPPLEQSLPPLLGNRAGLTMELCRPLPGNELAYVQIHVPIPGGAIDIELDRPARRVAFVIGIPLTVALVFLLITVTGLSVWAAWRITRPLRRLAETVDAFGQHMVAAPMPEHGPDEIRRAARAFNGMQAAIATFMQDRSRMLAAVSHDLRTPLTRLKLRVQLDQLPDSRAAMLRDIGQLQTMIDAALSFLRGQSGGEALELTDIAPLVTAICDEFAETGMVLSCDADTYAPCWCRPLSVRRAVVNLLDNARGFGTTAGVSVSMQGGAVVIDVADDGPGIPDQDKQRMLRPFTRMADHRSSRDGHVGLGLAIVQDVARAHLGSLELLDRQPCGLVARLRLPGSAPSGTLNRETSRPART